MNDDLRLARVHVSGSLNRKLRSLEQGLGNALEKTIVHLGVVAHMHNPSGSGG